MTVNESNDVKPTLDPFIIQENADKSQLSQVETELVVDSRVSRKLKIKADFILLPTLAIAYLLNSLDRSNISNAHTAGLADDLNLVSNQFNQVLTYYFIIFVIMGPVGVLLTKRFSARFSLAVMQLGFGTASLATGFVKSFSALVACRVVVGLFEAGYLASVIYYLSIWYTRKELATRLGIFYAALVSSSAFGGLLAYGVFHIPSGPYPSWAYLFFLEGSLTVLWAVVIVCILPPDSEHAWFLNEAERKAGRLRLKNDSVQGLDNKFNWKESMSEFRTFHPYIRAALAFCNGVVLTSNSTFLAMIVERMGFSAVKTNLYTVAPALTAAIILILCTKSSDYFQERGFHCVVSGLVSLIGYIILVSVHPAQIGVMYLAIFLCTAGAYPGTPLGSAWTVENIPNLNARAMTSGIVISIGNCGGLVSSNLYLAKEEPRYLTSLRANISFQAASIAIALSYTLWMRWENLRRDRIQEVENSLDLMTVGIAGTRDPGFRYRA
ncbi:retrograde regulation protein 2 [Penicillium waksmanii]|uniref:retrograde regulation protein 2 n=1 Tax=Penicillium waksmanii TaxID=69791 RepID=UPI0025479D11|nr:retrograde regulation protein 2 [Penicillium waksmanii]KAJ5976436.1 retrograde regulation protein 2 [Penicillium waksmanii]